LPKILIIENDASVAASLKQALETETYDYEDEVEAYAVELMTTAAEGLARATEGKFDALVTDLELAGPNGSELDSEGGLTLVRELHAKAPRLPVILMTAYHTSQTAIEAIRLGAYDYISKPLDMTALLDMIEQAVASSRRMLEPVALPLDATVAAPPNAVRIIGSSRVMESVYKEIGRVAATAVTVLIRGETGTGKELVARAIYQHSDRADKPFVVVNCAAIPETLLESELFGHEKGAFTGATERQIGRFEQANQGTIFLDEIGDMTMSTQAKLLRALEAKTINRLGGKEPIPINIRVIAATHKNLEQAILDKQFREDLFYRLNVAVIQLPPLRERKEDAPDLVRYFLQR
jgi:DNA-binding NtrC family response regulator